MFHFVWLYNQLINVQDTPYMSSVTPMEAQIIGAKTFSRIIGMPNEYTQRKSTKLFSSDDKENESARNEHEM